MFKKLIYKFSRPLISTFDKVDIFHVAKEAKLTFNMDLNSPYRWTPLIQVTEQSEEFLKKMRYFSRLQYFEDKHNDELIDTFIFEALKGTDFDYYYDYECKQNRYCPFHGRVDYLIYHKKDKYPIIPVVKSRNNTAYTPLTKELDMNIYQPVAIGLWALTNMFAAKEISKAMILQSDGNHWRILEMNTKDKFKKSGVYYSPREFNKIYEDFEMQKVVLGLIRFALQDRSEGEQALKMVYDFVDERRYLTDQGEPSKPSKVWKVVPKRIQRFFF